MGLKLPDRAIAEIFLLDNFKNFSPDSAYSQHSWYKTWGQFGFDNLHSYIAWFEPNVDEATLDIINNLLELLYNEITATNIKG